MTVVRSSRTLRSFTSAITIAALAACASTGTPKLPTAAPSPDPRVGLKAGMFDAGTAFWNMRLLSTTKPSAKFLGQTNSDLAFDGKYAIQGSYAGFQVWDISDPAKPALAVAFYCPASQSDVSVYKNLLFVSGEGTGGRLDCSGEGVHDSVSAARLRGIRIFDITDIVHPKYIANVQTCRGSHTHTVVPDPKDPENVYIYVSGSAGVRSPSELAGCSKLAPDQDPNSARFRIEVIKVPLAHPEQAAIVNSARIFSDLTEPKSHAEMPQDIAEAAQTAAAWRAKGGFTVTVDGMEWAIPNRYSDKWLDSIVAARKGTGAPTAADSATLRGAVQGIVNTWFGVAPAGAGPRPGPDQCHDITVYPAMGLAGGACEGYGLLLDIKDAAHPRRLGAVSDSNFSYWHSATFNNDATKLLFSDEWGGGGAPKCRSYDKPEWGADAIFTLANDTMHFRSYYKMLAPQTALENCVAHNGSLIPVPGRDIMVQSWYQGGISVFEWTDAAHPKEIAFFDRGPADSTEMGDAGTWSAYWYNGVIVSSEIGRGLDILELTASGWITQNELDAAKSVRLAYFNAQSQPKFVWPATFALAGAYVDQLARSGALTGKEISNARKGLARAQEQTGKARATTLSKLATQLKADETGSADPVKVKKLEEVLTQLAASA